MNDRHEDAFSNLYRRVSKLLGHAFVSLTLNCSKSKVAVTKYIKDKPHSVLSRPPYSMAGIREFFCQLLVPKLLKCIFLLLKMTSLFDVGFGVIVVVVDVDLLL